MSVQPRSADEDSAYRQLFDRSSDHAELRRTWQDASRTLASLTAAEATRLQRGLQRDHDAVQALDFFPGEAGIEAEAAWADLCRRIARAVAGRGP